MTELICLKLMLLKPKIHPGELFAIIFTFLK